ncbi:hypothetical protein [Nostoc sp. T09]|uniref:hypothetical protein n=1 Tax=Nostoc sp. T09 TaxID=1932621 RepID=UPI001C4EBEA3|nr:hypothetical protein [Nostoc sp. T09]
MEPLTTAAIAISSSVAVYQIYTKLLHCVLTHPFYRAVMADSVTGIFCADP